MRVFISSIQNELIKLLIGKRTWITLIIILGISIITAVGLFKENRDNQDWKADVESKLQSTEMELKNMEEMPYKYKKILNDEIELYRYYLEKNISPYEANVWKLINKSSGVMMILTIIIIIASSDSLAREFSKGTIKILLIRPINRWEILLSKFTALTLYSWMLIISWFILTLIIGSALFGGLGDFNIPHINSADGEIVMNSTGKLLLLKIIFQSIQILVFAAISFTISTLLRNNSIATAISLFLFLGSSIFYNLFQGKEWAKYILFSHLNLNEFINSKVNSVGFTLTESLLMISIYLVTILSVTVVIFSKKDIKV
ncbi:ABC transporter permease [Sediminibacillus albus]|uniref:ABC-2 type transport system permease protein n=1 Tax=Sediminibacillus albus TaxID=407036 RepID=A0A1G9A483_9BACI|nr:ABC transporter permease subunit [Sediminibacillus albus]SDK21664.1 ABC-2 type transport system permease protein [Sediminibacillus albus]